MPRMLPQLCPNTRASVTTQRASAPPREAAAVDVLIHDGQYVAVSTLRRAVRARKVS